MGATTLTVDSLADWPTDTAVHFTMFEIDANNTEVANTRTDWKAIKTSATTLGTLTLQAGTDREYPIGSKVICAPTAAWADDLVEGLLVSHDQDGTLKTDAVDVTAVIKDGIITNAKLVDSTITEAKTNTKPSEYLSDFIASGGVVAQTAGLTGSFTDIVYYISGVRYTKTGVANKTYTASKDTYVDINTSGTVTYTEVANGAASPALTSGYIRVAKVVTNGSAITSVTQISQDSLGNLIYPNKPQTQTSVTSNGFTIYSLGKIKLAYKQYDWETGSVTSGSIVNPGNIDLPTGYTTLTQTRTVSINGNATVFLPTWENSALYLRNVSGVSTDPGTITVYHLVICI